MLCDKCEKEFSNEKELWKHMKGCNPTFILLFKWKGIVRKEQLKNLLESLDCEILKFERIYEGFHRVYDKQKRRVQLANSVQTQLRNLKILEECIIEENYESALNLTREIYQTLEKALNRYYGD